MKVEWSRYDLIVFDMDGTLYDQPWLRRRMAAMLVGEALRSRSLAVPRVLSAYRRQREGLGADFAERQYRLPGTRPEAVQALVAEWMERRPLPLLRQCRARGVERLFARLGASRAVAIYSDFRAEAKLAALGLTARYILSAEDVGCLKPDPAGLHRLMEQAKAAPDRTLMIGDRDDRDGEAARRAGVRALIRGRDFRHYEDAIFNGA